MRNGTSLKTKEEGIKRQIDLRWPGNPVPLPRILDVLGPNLLRARTAAHQASQLAIDAAFESFREAARVVGIALRGGLLLCKEVALDLRRCLFRAEGH